MYKNIENKTKLNLKDLVDYQDGQVVSKTLVQNAACCIILRIGCYIKKCPYWTSNPVRTLVMVAEAGLEPTTFGL